ncbi:MAG TPA: ABC transporter ATP-binding protein [candidate division Zixibacteria bacterium]|nr:ABC transporter ATP-binding protein [candidate division Zixibacteria bacterium]
MTATEPAIELRDLRKAYGPVEAVRGIDLRVERGEVFALLGPNGAGKTTTVEILEGHRQRDGGEARVLGHDPGRGERDLRERIGIVLQSTGVEEYLTVREVVELHAGYYPRPMPVGEVLSLVRLTDQADRPVRRLSGGQRRRVDLAVALARDPELLFLDEPTTGFDPAARRQAWDVLRGLADLGKTIFLTTHYMDEAQALATRAAVIAAGRIVAEGSPHALGGREAARTRVRFGLPSGTELPDAFGARLDGSGTYELQTDNPTRLLHELSSWALSADAELLRLEVSRPSLEDVYLELVGAEVADGNEAADGPGAAEPGEVGA